MQIDCAIISKEGGGIQIAGQQEDHQEEQKEPQEGQQEEQRERSSRRSSRAAAGFFREKGNFLTHPNHI